MNHIATLGKMQAMKLRGMATAFERYREAGRQANKLTPDELTGHLVDAEWEDRQTRKLRRLVKGAKFRYQAGFESLDFSLKRKLDKDLIMRLRECDWIRKGRNVIITGPTGVGKSYLASALGHQACMLDFKVRYSNCLKLFAFLKQSQADHTYSREIRKIQKADLLVLDDFGLEPLDPKERMHLMEIMEDRHGEKSTVVVAQRPVKQWHEVIGDSTVADAICDRLVHAAYRFELDGENARKAAKT